MAKAIKYKLVKNNTSTAEDAPYLGVAIPVGSIATDDVINEMLANQTYMSTATAQYFLKALFEYAEEKISSDIVRISLGSVSLYPAISGSFDSEDAAFDPLRNSLYVGASFSQELRDEVAGIVPERATALGTSSIAMNSVMDIATEAMGVIDGTNDFRIAGIELTVPDGEDESLALVDKTTFVKVCDITVTSNDGGQRLTCHLPSTASIAAGNYKIRLVSHGLDPTASLAIRTLGVKLVTAVTPPANPIQFHEVAGGPAVSEMSADTGNLYITRVDGGEVPTTALTATLTPTGGGTPVVKSNVAVQTDDGGNRYIANPFGEAAYESVTGSVTIANSAITGTINFVAA